MSPERESSEGDSERPRFRKTGSARGRLTRDARTRDRRHIGSREPIRGFVEAATRRDTICEGEKTVRERKRMGSRDRKTKRRLEGSICRQTVEGKSKAHEEKGKKGKVELLLPAFDEARSRVL